MDSTDASSSQQLRKKARTSIGDRKIEIGSNPDGDLVGNDIGKAGKFASSSVGKRTLPEGNRNPSRLGSSHAIFQDSRTEEDGFGNLAPSAQANLQS